MEETISLKEIFSTLRKNLILIVTITLLGVMISAGVTFFLMTPKYDASTQILVNQANANTNSIYQQANTVQTNVQLVNTYSVIINNPAVLNQVIKKLNLDVTADELKEMLTVNTAQNSQVFTLTAETDSPAQSVKIVNGVAAAFKSQVQKVMNVDNVSILSPANVASSLNPVKPKATINIAIAFVVGLMVSIGLAFLLEYLDNTIKTEADIEKILNLPVLGVISEIKDSREPSNARSRSAAHTARRHQLRGAGHIETK